jgi:hypothetical protein
MTEALCLQKHASAIQDSGRRDDLGAVLVLMCTDDSIYGNVGSYFSIWQTSASCCGIAFLHLSLSGMQGHEQAS